MGIWRNFPFPVRPNIESTNHMSLTRRNFLQSAIAVGVTAALPRSLSAATPGQILPLKVTFEALDAAARQPILHLGQFREPVKIASIEIYEARVADGRRNFVVVRSTSGATGVSVVNGRVDFLLPILQEAVAPYFIGKDAREIEQLVDGVYLYESNYKLQSAAFWSPVAWVEFAVLDMLGQIARQPLSALFGGRLHDSVPMYYASGNRDTTPEQEADIIERRVAETGVMAIKFKVGGRMSNDADSLPGRSEALIPLLRKRLGPAMVIQADANGSYNPPKAIEIGRRLEDIGAYLFEEPCPFDQLEETKQVADALSINVAGGEQESSHHRFRWMIGNNAIQIVQPDLHYYGGMIRSTRVARMAAAAGLPMTMHLSGGVGYAQMLQFCSFTPNLGLFQEYKGDVTKTGGWFSPPILFKNGALNIPTAPGFGMTAADDMLKVAKKIS